MSELTDCPICLERYNKTEKVPKILNCGHTFCKECLIKLKNKYGKLECSICRENIKNDPEQLITNRTIFDLLYNPKIEENNIYERSNSNSITDEKLNFKIIMIGPANSGKTSIVRRYVDKKFNDDYKVTVGFDYMNKEITIGKKKVNIQLWDTAGTEMFQSLSSSYYRNSYGALVVFDVLDRKSFESLNTWINYYREHRDQKYEELIYLIGNKIDSKDRVISKKEAMDFMEENNLKEYYESSAKKGDNIDNIFNNIAKDLIKIYGNNNNNKSVRISLNRPSLQRKKEKKCKC
jgi:small GTP-binding protein